MPRDIITIRRRQGYFSAVSTDSAAATNFIARTSGLDATHINAYKALLNGFTTDGLFNTDGTSSFFDVLYIFATQNSTTALLNLVSSSFNGTANGGPTFTTDRGFTGTDSSATVYIDTSFNPTSGSPKYTRDSAHISMWSNSNTTSTAGGAAIGLNTGSTTLSQIYPKFNDTNTYYRINDGVGGVSGVTASSAQGHFLANRSGASAQQGYRNAVDLGVTAQASAAVTNGNFFVLAQNDSGPTQGDDHQNCGASIGGSLTPTQVTNFYNRLRTYMTAVGVP